jgi:endonuclease/exonuclease/phosphatase family metal-dependent hydrolase
VVSGDFNCQTNSSAYSLISQNMNDARNSSNEYNDAITYHAYHNGKTSLIDFIFYSSELEINNFKVINDVKNNYSDHYALYSSFKIN